MLSYRDAVAHCSSPALCFSEYTRIADGLTLVSHRFRAFLLAAFALTLLGGLASMFEMVHHRSSTLSLLNSGHLLVRICGGEKCRAFLLMDVLVAEGYCATGWNVVHA